MYGRGLILSGRGICRPLRQVVPSWLVCRQNGSLRLGDYLEGLDAVEGHLELLLGLFAEGAGGCVTGLQGFFVLEQGDGHKLTRFISQPVFALEARKLQKRLGKLTARDVRQFLAGLVTSGVGEHRAQYAHAILRSALEDAMPEEIIPRNVAKLVRPPHPAQKRREPLTVVQVRTLLDAVAEHRLYAMFVVFTLLGLRRSEVLGLQWSDVDLDQGVIRIRRGLHRVDGKLVLLPTKTHGSERSVPLPPIILRALRAHRKRQDAERESLGARWPNLGYVFTTPIGTPIDPRNCTRLVQTERRRAGLPQIRLHDLRHGCVSVLLDLGTPPRTVMEIVGHSTMEMTMTVYGHVSLDAMRSALDQFGGLLDDASDQAALD